MLQRTYPDQNCSIARTLEVIGERWTLLVIRDALFGLTRFDEFRTSLGIATNVLTARLDRLVSEGLLERRAYQIRPERHEYVLTDKGRELAPALLMLMRWGDRHYAAPSGPPRLAVHTGCGGELGEDFRCRRCAEYVDLPDIEFQQGPGAAP
jgi:DNA-binding HxlR family transcriptional regulator